MRRFRKEGFRIEEVHIEDYIDRGGFEEEGYTEFTISDFSLGLGNNYTDSHFISAIQLEHPGMVDYLRLNIGSGDDVIFIFDGIGGRYIEEWAGIDVIDFLHSI